MSYITDILILTYNDLSNIKECIDNIYTHTDSNDFNLFILDNGSTLDTIEYLKEIESEYSDIHISFQSKNYGIIKGRNKCFDFSKKKGGEYIIFLDSDQYVEEGWLESYLKMMKDYDVVGIEAWKMNNDFYPIRKNNNPNGNYSYVGAGGMMMKRNFFEKLGKFDERYEMMYFEDPDFCFLANKKGYKIGWNSNRVIIHNHHGNLLRHFSRKYFMANWKKFRKKWKGTKAPVFKNEEL